VPFNLQLDLFGAVEKFVEFRKINEWVKLYTSLVFSFWLAGSFTTGSLLLAHRPALEAIGAGLVSGSVFATVIWRNSSLTKGMQLALPEAEAEAEIKTDQQIISK
jgi:stage V sporulation protein SpoVS